jgi:hypothetical protein
MIEPIFSGVSHRPDGLEKAREILIDIF